MQKITLALDAMATRFELVLLGENPVQLRAAGEEALDEIATLGRTRFNVIDAEAGKAVARC